MVPVDCRPTRGPTGLSRAQENPRDSHALIARDRARGLLRLKPRCRSIGDSCPGAPSGRPGAHPPIVGLAGARWPPTNADTRPPSWAFGFFKHRRGRSSPIGPRVTVKPPTPEGLRDSRILASHCNGITECHGLKFVPTRSHGLGTGWLVTDVPSAEASSDPGEPGE